MNKFDFKIHSYANDDRLAKIYHILNSALNAVDPYRAILENVRRDNKRLFINNNRFNLNKFNSIYIIGAGKAGAPMARAIEDILGQTITKGVVVIKQHSPQQSNSTTNKIKLRTASHPIPNQAGVQGTSEILQLLDKATENDLVLCLISGGGSALLTAPVPSISLDDLQIMTKQLLTCGATIHEINTLRKHLSLVKGGGIAKHAAPAQIISLILSDVVGDPLDVIASGPTSPDSTTYSDCINILRKYDLYNAIPKSIQTYINAGNQGDYPETPKPKDPIFNRIINLIVGNNLIAAKAAQKQAQAEGFNALIFSTEIQGEAREVGKVLAAVAKQITKSNDPVPRPACIVFGGETTVTVRGQGLGGRNLELALSTVSEVAGLEDIAIITLATDGDDGPTHTAGAIVTGETYTRAKKRGLDPIKYLINNDSYHFFEPLGNLLIPGLTETNVNDLAFIFAF